MAAFITVLFVFGFTESEQRRRNIVNSSCAPCFLSYKKNAVEL